MTASIPPAEIAALRRARTALENPGIAARLAAIAGSPLERGLGMLPEAWRNAVHSATEAALRTALDAAVRSLGPQRHRPARERMHRVAAAASGAAGGAFGLPALAWELPLSTTVMLRSIADIAAAEGEDLAGLDARMACLTVFALGSGRDRRDDAAESGYFAVRSALAAAVSEATRHLAEKGLGKGAAPALLRLVSLIGARFGVVVGEKAAAQALPILGAAGGAVVNSVFIGHYQDMARAHFTVRRLERTYGPEAVRAAYEALGGLTDSAPAGDGRAAG